MRPILRHNEPTRHQAPPCQCEGGAGALPAEICLGLYVLHTNKILHRDIKAANVFVGENDRIMLGDLGIAKLAKTEGLAAKTQIGALPLPPPPLFFPAHTFTLRLSAKPCTPALDCASLNAVPGIPF